MHLFICFRLPLILAIFLIQIAAHEKKRMESLASFHLPSLALAAANLAQR